MLNEALAKEVERNVRRAEEIGSTARDLAVPRELKDMPNPLDSDSRKRRAVKAATAVASSCSSQMEGSRAVAETPTQQNSLADRSGKDVEEEERDEYRSSTAPNTRRRIATKTSLDESRTDDEGEEGDEFRSSTQESWDGICEEAMRIASITDLEIGSSAGDGPVQGEQRTTRALLWVR